jgi:hypothetical protein
MASSYSTTVQPSTNTTTYQWLSASLGTGHKRSMVMVVVAVVAVVAVAVVATAGNRSWLELCQHHSQHQQNQQQHHRQHQKN